MKISFNVFSLFWFFLIVPSLAAQAQGEAVESNAPPQNVATLNEPPDDREIIEYTGPRNANRTLFEEQLSYGILLFFFLALFLESILVFFEKINGEQGLRLLAITLIIGSSLFLVTAGYNNDQIAPIIGLLGTVAGYLLGNTKAKAES